MSEGPRMDGMSPIYDAPCPQILPLTTLSRVLSPCPIPHHSLQIFPTTRQSHILHSHPPPPPAHRPRNLPHHQPRLPFKYPRSTSQELAATPYRKWRYRRQSIAACQMFRSRQIPAQENICLLPSQLLVPGLVSPSEMYVLLSVSSPLIDFEMSRQVSHSVLSSCYFAIKQYFSHSYRRPGLRRRHVGFGKIYHGRHQ